MRRAAKAALTCFAILFVLGAVVGLYAGSYSRAGEEAEAAYACAQSEDGFYFFGDTKGETGIILYPGGKVEYTAYASLAETISDETGALCAVCEMPLNLAVLDSDAADAVVLRFGGIKTWYVGGHSLGGAMAASYAADNPDRAAGVILLAAYSTESLEVPVLSVYGECDGVLDAEKYDSYRENLPAGFCERIIAGANHAGFADYGAQKGDNEATITPMRQQLETARIIGGWLDGFEED